MFIMTGNKAELCRYKVVYVEDGINTVEKCISEEHKNLFCDMLKSKDIEFSVETIHQDANEWFNGLRFRSYDEAINVYNEGKQIFLERKAREELINNTKLRADIDYISIISGVDIY